MPMKIPLQPFVADHIEYVISHHVAPKDAKAIKEMPIDQKKKRLSAGEALKIHLAKIRACSTSFVSVKTLQKGVGSVIEKKCYGMHEVLTEFQENQGYYFSELMHALNRSVETWAKMCDQKQASAFRSGVAKAASRYLEDHPGTRLASFYSKANQPLAPAFWVVPLEPEFLPARKSAFSC